MQVPLDGWWISKNKLSLGDNDRCHYESKKHTDKTKNIWKLVAEVLRTNQWMTVCVCVTLEWNNKKQKEHMLEISWKHYLSAYEMKYLHNLIKPQEYAKNDKFSNENIWMNHECIFGKMERICDQYE